jgi:hypothetical protein
VNDQDHQSAPTALDAVKALVILAVAAVLAGAVFGVAWALLSSASALH